MTNEEYIKMIKDYQKYEKKEQKRIRRQINRTLRWCRWKKFICRLKNNILQESIGDINENNSNWR